jgi:hypothetical protein
VLEQDERRGGVRRDVLDDVPRVLVGECVLALGRGLCPSGRAGLEALLVLDAEPDERADVAAELDGLLLGQVAEMLDLDLALRVLVDREGVDDPDGVALPQRLELGDDLAVEVRMPEPSNRSAAAAETPTHVTSTPMPTRRATAPRMSGRRRAP